MSRLVWPLYAAAGRLAAPLAAPYLARRARAGKEDPARSAEKRGIASVRPFDARPVWLHAVSVGESVAALAVADRIVACGGPVLLTTSTPASAARVAPVATGERVVHQYAPLDAPPFVARFLAHWRPVAAVFVEAEVWPTTLFTLQRRGVPRAHVNARMSARSFAGWRRWPALASPVFAAIDLVLAQSDAQADRFATLGARDVRTTGNVKFDADPPLVDPVALAALRTAIGTRPVWLAASTHSGEEEIVLAAHREVARQHPDLLTIIAPRHADRGAAVAALAGPLATRRSLGEPPTGGVYVADTFGELGTLFALVPVVFVGGSLVPIGGHNAAEPAAAGAALLTGPSHGEMFDPFLAAGAARMVVDEASLAKEVMTLLEPSARAPVQEAARRTLAQERGALDRTMVALGPWLDAACRSAPP